MPLKKPERWEENSSCYDTEFKIFKHVTDQNISRNEAKGIISMLCREWFGENKGRIINLIINLKSEEGLND